VKEEVKEEKLAVAAESGAPGGAAAAGAASKAGAAEKAKVDIKVSPQFCLISITSQMLTWLCSPAITGASQARHDVLVLLAGIALIGQHDGRTSSAYLF
jgi:hypothetical protein